MRSGGVVKLSKKTLPSRRSTELASSAKRLYRCVEAASEVDSSRSVDRALARKGRLRVGFPRQRAEQWIDPQRVVVAQVLVAKAQAQDALHREFSSGVLDPKWVAVVAEAAREALDDPGPELDFPEQHRPAVRADSPPVESGHDLAAALTLELEFLLRTLCLHHRSAGLWCKVSVVTALCHTSRSA